MSARARRVRALAYIRPRFATAKKADLERWAAELELEVTGTGADGAVTKEDLQKAVSAELEG